MQIKINMGYKAIKESEGGESINYGISKDNNINKLLKWFMEALKIL